MVCEVENILLDDMEIEPVPSMWPEDIGDAGKQFNIEQPGKDQDMLEEVNIMDEPTIVDFKHLMALNDYTEKGSTQLAYLVKRWEYKQANVVRLLKEELDNLSRQKQEVEQKRLEILEEHRFEEGDQRPISVLDDMYDFWKEVPRRKADVIIPNKKVEVDAEYDTAIYWKQRAMHVEKLLEASMQREHMLTEKLQDSINNLENQSSPVEELSQILKRADNFLHFILQNAPVVIGHQDKELKYRFIYNHFPTLHEEDIIGKTDVEIFTGGGVKESQEFKREVLEKGLPAKREITFDTELFGAKTFLIYVEPVFSKTGETIGINYMGMDVTDQVRIREKMAKLREEIAVQKAKETELNKTIHITEETMRAKQMLATMSHEIRSPLSGVVSMAEILARTRLDKEQRQLLDVMLSSGDLVLQLINDILDLSKVESGVMKLEATKFRPREVVKHVLQTAAASLKKTLILEGHISDDVPIEVIGDVLRIRQILTNLISNAIKFTHEGKVGINLYVVPEPVMENDDECRQNPNGILSNNAENKPEENHTSVRPRMENETEEMPRSLEMETTVWIRCDVYDTGIGIPENALPTLFKKYMQVRADHARKYGGTGLGLAICKQLVELMGGRMTVTSQEHFGSTFTFLLPYKVSTAPDNSDDADDVTTMTNHETVPDDITEGFFQFHPRSLGSLFPLNGSSRTSMLLPNGVGHGLSGTSEGSQADNGKFSRMSSPEDASSIIGAAEALTEPECSPGCSSSHESTSAVITRKHGNQHFMPDHADLQNQAELEQRNGNANLTLPGPCETMRKSCESSECTTAGNLGATATNAKPKILLVEDNNINIMVTQSMMKQLGHGMDIVKNGVEAVQAVQRCCYDLILMDVCMPKMNGLQATRLIRSFEQTGNWDAAAEAGVENVSLDSPGSISNSSQSTRRVPIIAMTANALAESADECFENGMDSFVSKPVTFQKLKDSLDKFLPSHSTT
ncbi:hypothetical protein MLD38_035235 [Melastoma candidum]|uniref:Uncharacterized protein n=1 Tax=Melastoma candidum TaxID=119954 RepID=A0ACB9MD34_9MYRT|nr:hypothetical protein MLD38_035235 [Melastoma candidum]